ncbi:MAG: prolyl oligopeptidase family serine peptidase [Acidimicrobiia bacterium]|nr:prolyl oligopeptidase family serine peptidase [Acidimicrobiia bacterium]
MSWHTPASPGATTRRGRRGRRPPRRRGPRPLTAGLEDGAAPDTRDWAGVQNARRPRGARRAPRPRRLLPRLTDLLGAGTSLACALTGGRVFSIDRWAGLDQAVLVERPADRTGDRPPEPRVLVDPRELTGDATAAIDWYEPSPDGGLVAVGISTGGDEQSTLHVLEVATGAWLDDEISRTRAASVAWEPAGTAFAYTRYPAPGEVPDAELHYHRVIRHHLLGDDPDADPVLWDALPDPSAWPHVAISRDGRWVLVHVSLGWNRVDVHLLDRRTHRWEPVIEGVECVSAFEIDSARLVGVTTLDADRGRVVEVPLATPTPRHWTTLLAESDAVVESAACTADSLVVHRTQGAVSELLVGEPDGSGLTPLHLPGPGTVAGLSTDRENDRAVLAFTSFTRPPALHRWSVGTVLEPWSDLPADVDPDRFRVTRHRFPSTDGAEIWLSVVESLELDPDEPAPTVLTGYGGFALTLSPTYDAAVVSWCEDGGRWVVANIRGGAEEGEAWHRAGQREHKQQAFDDFCAAADWLVANGLTDPRAPRDPRGQQRRTAGGRGTDPTIRPLRGRALRRAAARHGALPPVPDRPAVDPRVRRPRRRRRVRLAARLLALSPGGRRHVLSRRAAHHRGGGLPGGPQPRPQDGGPSPGGVVVRGPPPGAAARRDTGGPRPGQAGVEAGRRAGRRARLPGLAARAHPLTVP